MRKFSKSLMESIDTTTINGKVVFHIFGALAEFERGLISERTRAGLEAARARGRKGGRKKGLSQKARLIAVTAKSLYENSEENKMSTQDIADRLGISRPVFWTFLNTGSATRQCGQAFKSGWNLMIWQGFIFFASFITGTSG